MSIAQNIRDHAALAGFTRLVWIDFGHTDFEAYVRPEADLEGSFRAICALEGDDLRINGWNALAIDDVATVAAAA